MYFKHIVIMKSCTPNTITRPNYQKIIPRSVNTVLEVTNEYIQKILNIFINFGSRHLPLCHVLVRKVGSSSDW